MNTRATNPDRHKKIEAAIVFFINKGFHATSMRDIANQANVSLGNPYTDFSGKQQLIAEVAELGRLEYSPSRKHSKAWQRQT